METDGEKAETLNAYFGSVDCLFFGSVYSQEDVSIMPSQELRSEATISDVAFTSQDKDCPLAHMDINKSPGPDGIHSRVLRETHEEICEPLRMIFKLLREGSVPKSWKQATAVPIFKKGKKSNPANYRPVNLTSTVCKLMEKIIRKALIKHMDENYLLSTEQYQFHSGRLSATQLLEVLEQRTRDLDGGHNIDCMYLDNYRKAFDSVPHQHLLCKLESYGIEGCLLNLMEEYLTGRSKNSIRFDHYEGRR